MLSEGVWGPLATSGRGHIIRAVSTATGATARVDACQSQRQTVSGTVLSKHVSSWGAWALRTGTRHSRIWRPLGTELPACHCPAHPDARQVQRAFSECLLLCTGKGWRCPQPEGTLASVEGEDNEDHPPAPRMEGPLRPGLSRPQP